MMAAGRDNLDARFSLVTEIPIPPLLYLSLEPGDMRLDGFIELLHRDGLPRFTVTPTEADTGSWDVYPAEPGWRVVLGPGRQVAVLSSRPEPVAEDIGQHAPPGWYETARAKGKVVVLVGPARPFKAGPGKLAEMLEDLLGLNVLAGLVDVVDRELPAGLSGAIKGDHAVTDQPPNVLAVAQDLVAFEATLHHLAGHAAEASCDCGAAEIASRCLALLQALRNKQDPDQAIIEAVLGYEDAYRRQTEARYARYARERAEREHKATEEEITRRVVCPYCGAGPQMACRSLESQISQGNSHRGRYRLARGLNDQTSPDEVSSAG